MSENFNMDDPLYQVARNQTKEPYIDPADNGFHFKEQPCYNALLKHFSENNKPKTIIEMKTVYVYNKTHYQEFTPLQIKGYAEDHFFPKPKEKIRAEFLHKVFANNLTRRSFFTESSNGYLNFKNGVLNLTERSLLPHSHEYGFRNVLPYEYEPNAKCPTFDWWIKDVMMDDAELVNILQEFMGYVVRGGEYKYHKALWLSGTGRNGKSTFLDVLKALIGHGNYSTLSIKSIVHDKFVSSDLDGKIANFSEETSPEELSDSGPFKNLTGDGDLSAQKKYGDVYSFRNKAKLIMTYNETPNLKDLSPGMLSRPIIIPWKRDLTNDGDQDKTLKDKLLAELPGIFNFALAGFDRLEAQGAFSKSDKSTLEMEEIKIESCSVAQWIRARLVMEPPMEWASMNVLLPKTLYDDYKANTTYPFSEQKFYKRLNNDADVKLRKNRTAKGWEYRGFRFVSNFTENFQPF